VRNSETCPREFGKRVIESRKIWIRVYVDGMEMCVCVHLKAYWGIS